MSTTTDDAPLEALLVVALVAEALPLVRRLEGRRWVSRGLVTGTLAGVPVAVLRCGVGRTRALRATRTALRCCPARRVVSLGTCGALVDTLRVGDVVVGEALLDTPSGSLRPMGGLVREATIATVPKVVDRPARRAEWAALGAEVCEMEAAGVFEAAESLPFHALKVVSDHAGGRASTRLRHPRWVAMAIFQQRALRLVERRLTPVLLAWLEGLGPL